MLNKNSENDRYKLSPIYDKIIKPNKNNNNNNKNNSNKNNENNTQNNNTEIHTHNEYLAARNAEAAPMPDQSENPPS